MHTVGRTHAASKKPNYTTTLNYSSNTLTSPAQRQLASMETPSDNLFSSSTPNSSSPTQPIQEFVPTAMAEDLLGFEDFLPSMAEKLGAEGLVEELCKGFQLLMDARTGLITLESLKRNAARLGLEGLGDDELLGMITEGDLDGDGALDQMEFCVLMVRLSPELMQGSQRMFEEVIGM